MSRKKRQPVTVDVRAILESPVGKVDFGRSIGAYEAGMRRAAERAASGNMAAAGQFLGELLRYGLLQIPEPEEHDQYVAKIPKEWDHEEWEWMFDQHGRPPWPGEHDGLISKERWEANYGSLPRPRRRSRRKR